jgi:hypothetical protein
MNVRANKKGLLAIGIAVFTIIVGASYLFIHYRASTKLGAVRPVEVFGEPQTGLQLEYPAELEKSALTQDDAKSNITLRLKEKAGQTPLLITVRNEAGLRVVVSLTKQELLPLLMGNSERALPQRFKGYSKLSSRTLQLNGTAAGEIIFTYDSPGGAGGRIKQRFLIYPKGDDSAVYVAAQAQEKDFDATNQQYFEPVFKSLSF